MNKNQLTVVKNYEFDKPLIQKIDSIIDNGIRDCHKKYFHTFDLLCVYDINFTNNTNNQTVNFAISDKNLNLYEVNKKLTVARQKGFTFNQINKPTIKIHSNISRRKIHYYSKVQIPIMHRQFFKILSQNRNMFKLIVIIEITLFISQVVNGLYIIIHNINKVTSI